MSWATSSISTAGLLHIIYSGGGRLSAAACHLALFLFMGGLLCPIPAAGTDSKQRIRPGVVCIRVAGPRRPVGAPKMTISTVSWSLSSGMRCNGDMHERAAWTTARLTCWSDAIGDWRDGRHGEGCVKSSEKQQSKRVAISLSVGRILPYCNPEFLTFPPPFSPVAWGVWPYKFLLAIRHAHYLYSPPSDPILLLVLAAMRMPAADAYPNDFHVRYPRRWSLASGPVGREMDERAILTDHGISGVSMPARRPLRSSFPHGKQTLTETIPRPSCVCDDWA